MDNRRVKELCRRVLSQPIWRTITDSSNGIRRLVCMSCGVRVEYKIGKMNGKEFTIPIVHDNIHCIFGLAMDIIQELNDEEKGMKPQYQIEDWILIPHTNDEGESYLRLEGFIKGRSPEIFESEPAHTSKVIRIVTSNEDQMASGICTPPFAETLNSIYKLGKHRNEQQ